MSRRPPSARDPRNVGVTRTIPAINRSTKGASASRLASPLPQSVRSSPVAAGGGDSDHDGTGANSTAVGTGALAAGDNSTTLGDGADDGGEAGNVIIGYQAYAYATGPGDASDSVVIGASASTTDAYNVVVVGRTAQTSGDTATAVGNHANVLGYAGVALGPSTRVDGDSGMALGDHARAEGTAGIAIGSGAHAYSTDDSMAIGEQAHATGERSWAIGTSATVTTDHAGVLRANSVEIQADAFLPSETSLILRDSSGARWAVTVDTTGHLTTTAL